MRRKRDDREKRGRGRRSLPAPTPPKVSPVVSLCPQLACLWVSPSFPYPFFRRKGKKEREG